MGRRYPKWFIEELTHQAADRYKVTLPKPPVLLLFQNMHGGGGRQQFPTYTPSSCYMKNATYSRVLPKLMPYFTLRLAECTARVAARGDHRTKFPRI